MKAVTREQYGPASVLTVSDVPRPEPGEGELLVQVLGTSINMGDRLILQGRPVPLRLAFGLWKPSKPGMGQDLAGLVAAVGPGVDDFAVGDAVYGEVTGGSTWAEFALAPADKMAAMPANTSFELAGALPVAGMTAMQAVHDHGGVQPGQRVLVNGASGAVGSYVLQIAVAAGASVTAVVGSRYAEQARELGATEVIDRDADFLDPSRPYDVVLDVVSSRPLPLVLRALKPGGAYVSVGGPPYPLWRMLLRFARIALANLFTKQRLVIYVSDVQRHQLEAMSALVEAGRLKPVIDRRVSLDDWPAAVAAVEAGEVSGRVVLAAP